MSSQSTMPYLAPGLPIPVAENDGLSAPYWKALRENRLLVQRCRQCSTWQFGPEWLCHQCHAFDPDWQEVEPLGLVYAYQRVWHPVHPALREQGPYLVVLVELPRAGRVRMLGNLLGDPKQAVSIGTEVSGVFEHHEDAKPAYSLLQWRVT